MNTHTHAHTHTHTLCSISSAAAADTHRPLLLRQQQEIVFIELRVKTHRDLSRRARDTSRDEELTEGSKWREK